MRKAQRIASIGMLVLAAGCVRIEQNLTIRSDASCEFDLSYSIKEQAVSRAKAMFKLTADMARAAGEKGFEHDALARLFFDPGEPAIREACARYEQHGVVLNSVKVETRGGSRQVRLKLTFENLRRVSEADFFKRFGFGLARNSRGHYVLYRAPAEKVVPEGLDWADPETMKLLTPLMAGFALTVRVHTPAKILKTNAPRKTTHSAEWTFDFDEDPKAILAMQNAQMGVLFEGQGLQLPVVKWEPPGKKAEPAADTGG